MRKNDFKSHSLGKRILVATLAMSMACSGTTFAGMNSTFKSTKVAEANYKFADANCDGKVDLNDAKTVLKVALGIGAKLDEVAEKNADVDYSSKVDLNDAKLILQFALGIKKTADYEKPTETTPTTTTPGIITPTPYVPGNEEVTEKPTATPKTTFTPVEAKADSTVSGKAIVVDSEAKSYSNAFIENYKDNEGMYAFYDNEQKEDKSYKDDTGMKMENPIAGRKEFVESVTGEGVTSLDAPEGKVNAWTLEGAHLEAFTGNTDFTKIDPRIYNQCNPEEVEYTIPKWTKGLTLSFWAKVKNPADPIVTFTDDDNSFILYVRANGTVKFNAEKENENKFDMASNSITPLGTVGEWTYYTITIANDWVGVYVNGQENIYDSTVMLRSTIQNFNQGFLTRMNPIIDVTEEMVNQNEHTKYYWTKIDATSTLLNQRAPWYYNKTEGVWMAHDEFSVFKNARFRGANGQGTSIMEFLTKSETSMFIGGVDSAADKGSCVHMFKQGAMFADVEFFEQELTPVQIASNYEYVAKNNKPEDLDFPGENPNKDDPNTPDEPVEVVTGASVVTLRNNGLGVNADYDEPTNTFTFKEPTANTDGDIKGVRMNNPFAAVKNGDDKSYLRSTIEEALTGQAIFPYKYPDDYPDESLAGKYVSKTHPSNLTNLEFKGHGACDSASVNTKYGNFYDKYYGDVYAYGNEMTVKTGIIGANGSILPLEKIEETYTGDDVHTYQRPVWSTGVTLSFWAKPVKVDDSPLVTFYNSNSTNGMLLTVDTMGSVFYSSLYEAENNAGDWESGKVLTFNGKPRNTFSTFGDSSYVKAGEWNYYTITIANDWIQVYVNGVEMVYKKVNFNRGDTKYFNNGYLTRYNPTGIYTDTMIQALVDSTGADTTGKTLEGTPRNYLLKSGYYLNTTEEYLESARNADQSDGPYDVKGLNNNADSASVRSNGVYADPYVNHTGSGLLMDLMTDRNVQMYIGGVAGALKLTNKFAFSSMTVSDEDLAAGNVNAYPVSYIKEDVLTQDGANQNKIFVDAEDVIAVSADTEGAVKLGLKDISGKDIYVNKACNVVSTGLEVPEGAYTLQRETSEMTIESRRKIYTSDHLLSAGTKVSGMVSYYSELSAQEVKDAYEAAAKDKPAN